MKKLLYIIAAALLCLPLASCGGETESENLSVYTSFYAMSDFAELIGGDRVDVVCMVPSGTEPHEWEPSAADTAKLSEADVFIYNGAGMEHWVDSVLAATDGINAVNTSDYVTILDETDPHIWLSPMNALAQMTAIADAFQTADPDNADYYSERLLECAECIEQIDAEYRAAGLDGMLLITAHEAYGYLCEEYGMEMMSIDNGTSVGDASPARAAAIVEAIRETGTKYIYCDPTESSDIAETCAAEAGCEVLPLSAFENETEGRDYFTVMEDNLTELKKNL